MKDGMLLYGGGAALLLLLLAIAFVFMRSKVPEKRMARVTGRRGLAAVMRSGDAMSLRRKTHGSIPMLGKLLQSFTSLAALQYKMERAGMKMNAELYVTICFGVMVSVVALFVLTHKPLAAGLVLGVFFGYIVPRFMLNFKVNKRLKKFLILFPDAIDFIVRGLRSGLPVTESMNMVGKEMEEPVGSLFAGIGESVKLGVPLEKALQETAKKLKSTEFNFFTTSIILQRETGGNLSEILSNLSDVLRKRFMMRMKIKAMASEARASAMIVGSLPFIVLAALSVVAPDYLIPLYTMTSGMIAAGCAALSLTIGITVMVKMAQFEI